MKVRILLWVILVVLVVSFGSVALDLAKATRAQYTERLATLNAELLATQNTLDAVRLELATTASTLAQERADSAATPQCVRVRVDVPVWEMGALVTIGETALCATQSGRLVWANEIYGPAFNEEESLAEAWNEASRWRDCAEYIRFCPEGWARGVDHDNR